MWCFSLKWFYSSSNHNDVLRFKSEIIILWHASYFKSRYNGVGSYPKLHVVEYYNSYPHNIYLVLYMCKMCKILAFCTFILFYDHTNMYTCFLLEDDFWNQFGNDTWIKLCNPKSLNKTTLWTRIFSCISTMLIKINPNL